MEVAAVLLVATGFALGIAHSLDADHVVAVSTLICNSPSLRKSIISATAWGAGHSVTLFLVGLLVLALRIVIPEYVLRSFELVAGVLLVILGVLVINPIIASKLQQRRQRGKEGGQVPEPLDNPAKSRVNVNKSIFTGVVQGLAGSAALMLVTLTTVDSTVLGLIFILMFGVGVVLGMVSIACLISSLLTLASARLKKAHEVIHLVTGVASISFGIFIIVQAAFQYHL